MAQRFSYSRINTFNNCREAYRINYIEGINQSLTTTSDVDFNTVTATTFTGGLSGNATTSSGCTGNSATATALATPRDFSLTGFVTGTGTGFDGSGNLSINTSLAGSIADGNISSSGTWNTTTNTVNTGSSDWDDAYGEDEESLYSSPLDGPDCDNGVCKI